MTLATRLARLETATTPRDAVLAWVAEAHEYPTLPEYIAAVRDVEPEDWPLARLARGIETAVRARVNGPEQEVWQAVRSAVGDALFLVELVLEANLAAREVRDVAGLRWALLTKWSGMLAAEAELARVTRHGDADHATGEAQDWRDTLAVTLTELYSEEFARASLERRYLAGRSMLFPAPAQEWADLVERLEWLAKAADRLSGADPGSASLDVAALRSQASEGAPVRAQELADLARIHALDLLGERERVLAVLEGSVRPATSECLPTTGSGSDSDAARTP